MAKKKSRIKNPLRKRIGRELAGDWRKYLVVSLFLILTIGFVSGMYVANGSMMQAAEQGEELYALEDGHFELDAPVDKAVQSIISTGAKADVRQYYLEKAQKELDERFDGEFEEEFIRQLGDAYVDSGAGIMESPYAELYEEARTEAYAAAWEELQKEVEEEYAEAEEKYELDDPNFAEVKVSLYEFFYRNEDEDYDNDGTADGTIRVYADCNEINRACLMEGSFPRNADEIAVDRMHADNVGIRVGDTITVGAQEFLVSGLIAYVNYSTLHEKATDTMFDALKFDVAMVTDKGFDRLQEKIRYAYSWRYEDRPEDEIEEKEKSDDFMRALLTQAVVHDRELEDYLPRYANPAVNFATEDMGSDEAMGGVLLDILIVIIAFIFAVTISNTIVKEASAIGTLRASGYTKGELIRHYLSMPVIVTLIAAAVGNLLGYTVFKNLVVSMYYNSYSLPQYRTIWNSEAFFKTTMIPAALMLVVNLIVISGMMQHTPLQFLRHALKRTKRKKAMRLPNWRFLNRFRLRIIFQNASNYVILFMGIFFVMVMLAMAVGMPSTLDYYKKNAQNMMFADYQYVLTDCKNEDGELITTEYQEAEPFSMCALQKKGEQIDEEVSVYGISEGSRYVQLEQLSALDDQEVYISDSFGEKYGLQSGDSVCLDEKYEKKQYEFKVAGIYDGCQSIAVFMPIAAYREVFGAEDEFTGYFSDTELTDLPEEFIAAVITERDIMKMCEQLDHSMGAYMTYFQYLCVLLSAVMIYLLTKIIIEKNENAISMTKILGYENGEIAGLYLFSTTVMVVLADLVSVVLGTLVMGAAWRNIMNQYSGWYAFQMEPAGYAKMFVFVLIGYLAVMLVDFERIKRIPMEEALKNAE